MARATPEWTSVGLLFILAVVFQQALQAPVEFPSASQLSGIELGYLVPFIVLCVWVAMPLPRFRQRRGLGEVAGQVGQQALDALCFGLVLFLHFHIKLWAPLLHPVTYDPIFEILDRNCFSWMQPLIAWRSHWPQMNVIDHLYLVVFLWMFFLSFVVHSIRGRQEFRRVFLASILVQAFGALLFVIVPAMGPFIYHASGNACMGHIEQFFYSVHQDMLAGGNNWLQVNTGVHLTHGLAAFPSLHAACSFVFLYYAWRYCRWLTLLYVPAFAWIIFEAMATRWHYGIDLVAGVALACGCIVLSDLWMGAHEDALARPAPAPEDATHPLPEPIAPQPLLSRCVYAPVRRIRRIAKFDLSKWVGSLLTRD